MEHVLAAIDASTYATSVCRYAAWAAVRLSLPVELLHVVQHPDPVTARKDLSGAIGLGVKSDLMEELVRLSRDSSRIEIGKGRVLLAAGEQMLREAGVAEVAALHRHGGVVETILEREESARLLVLGKRGVAHESAGDHIGSMIERVVRASARPVLVASRDYSEPKHIVFAYDASPAADRALERLANSPLFEGLPVTIVMAEASSETDRARLARAEAGFAPEHSVTAIMERGKAEQVIPGVVAATEDALLLMGAYGHSPIRRMILGSTTSEMVRTVKAPVLMVR
ncbi:universal stress protein UspA [Erythrobacter sp. QSSC1-22B]|uniref:universal stress protein n=1 Tax=Erythrobacter sp. QSSC1-22B TaxID=1860125 RepID=UPI000804DF77|nr:universal stress protein [Erythrobacter sp. QSSC1-22B]OBX18621.1 universal stress protein UspA [Erythrobacter sp. QSSC1-22B]